MESGVCNRVNILSIVFNNFRVLEMSFILLDSVGCFVGNGADYIGEAAVTSSGRPCQRWDSQLPNRHGFSDYGNHSFCRNIRVDEWAPWCYNGEGTSPRWEFCDIPRCRTQEPLVPQVLVDGEPHPICSHGFVDNNNGASEICRLLGNFYGGTVRNTNAVYERDAVSVGRCLEGERLEDCTGGLNAWGNFGAGDGHCRAGNAVGIEIVCHTHHCRK
jgi:hypothetical protein